MKIATTLRTGNRRIFLGALALTALIISLACGSNNSNAPSSGNLAGQVDGTRGAAPLPDSGFRATIAMANTPQRMRAGQTETLRVRVRNNGDAVWPAHGRSDTDSTYAVTLRNRWLNSSDNSTVNDLDGGTPIVRDIRPGQEVELTINVNAPANPGEYILELDMVQEQIAWFGEKGSETLRARIRVER